MTNKLEYYTRAQICNMIINNGKPLNRAKLKKMLDNGEIEGFKLGDSIVILKEEWTRFKGGYDVG